ncbi:MAG TPA: MOSC domain-containing protein [Jatrophihabitantaceae bacterium]|nr:MOSC domain-containing protein [Jatrophihabitantaceae bacterium]
MTATVIAVARDAQHRFSKSVEPSITLVEGVGVDGDAHAGITVQHRSRLKATPTAPNLRQVHLVSGELLDELNEHGFDVRPGDIGENVTTRALDLLALPTGTRLRLGVDAVVEITGLRNPCIQLDRFQDGLRAAVLDHDVDGNLIRRAGVMSVVVNGGDVRPGDEIAVELPTEPHSPLQPV